MAVEQVELGKGCLPLVAHQQHAHARVEVLRADAALGEKALAEAAEVVVHRRIHHVALQIVAGVLPHLADDDGILLRALHRLPEGAQKAVVHLVGHVQPPAVYVVFAHPVRADGAEIVAQRGIGGVGLGHLRHVGKTGVARRLALRGEAHVLRQGIVVPPERRSLAAPQHVLKEGMAPTGVVEHAVDDDAQAHAVRLVHQRAELRVRAHAGIDVEVVQQVVFVIRIGGEHGVEIDAVAPQIAYIAEVEAHALHRAAQPRGAHFPVPELLRPLAANGRPPGGEAVREDVVHYGVRRPRGHFQPVGAVVVGKLEALVALPRQLALEAVSVVVPNAVFRLQFKAVAHAL